MKFPAFAGTACLLLLLAAAPLPAQDPGAAQDEVEARKKLLRAADQIDLIQSNADAQTAQVAALKAQLDDAKGDLDSLRAQIAALKADNAALHASLEKLDAARAQERQLLLDQVSKIVADGAKKTPAPAPEPKPSAPTPSPSDASGEAQKGYEYVVVKGDTLHAIAAAYAAQGVHVTVEELRKANNLSKTDTIHVGQKLFVPKK